MSSDNGSNPKNESDRSRTDNDNRVTTDHVPSSEVEELRLEVLDELQELREDVKSETGRELGFVKKPINLAEYYLLNDGEFNHNVRLALIQLWQAVDNNADDRSTTIERIEAFDEQLAQKAALPPSDQVER